MADGRENEGLKALGKKTTYSDHYDPSVLETFSNMHPDNDYWVRFNCPEFTTLCPITGQPDFAEIRISYIPDQRMVESKSLKLYLMKSGTKVRRKAFSISQYVRPIAGFCVYLQVEPDFPEKDS